MTKVIVPSIRNRYCEPPNPCKPRMRNIPGADRVPTMLHMLSAVQKYARRSGSSLDSKKLCEPKDNVT
jgi:hypothetical protein